MIVIEGSATIYGVKYLPKYVRNFIADMLITAITKPGTDSIDYLQEIGPRERYSTHFLLFKQLINIAPLTLYFDVGFARIKGVVNISISLRYEETLTIRLSRKKGYIPEEKEMLPFFAQFFEAAMRTALIEDPSRLLPPPDPKIKWRCRWCNQVLPENYWGLVCSKCQNSSCSSCGASYPTGTTHVCPSWDR